MGLCGSAGTAEVAASAVGFCFSRIRKAWRVNGALKLGSVVRWPFLFSSAGGAASSARPVYRSEQSKHFQASWGRHRVAERKGPSAECQLPTAYRLPLCAYRFALPLAPFVPLLWSFKRATLARKSRLTLMPASTFLGDWSRSHFAQGVLRSSPTMEAPVVEPE